MHCTQIHVDDVMRRVDSAKQEAIKLFINPKSKTDFYFEDLLNCFISLTQYPLNFAVFLNSGNQSKLLFHLCADKEHEAKFDAQLQHDCSDTSEQTLRSSFQVFPDILESRFSVVIYHMNTKAEGGVQLVAPNRAFFASHDGTDQVDSFEKYISLCAHHFFEKEWDVFDSCFSKGMRKYVEKSLTSIAKNHTNWGEKQGSTLQAMSEIPYPNDVRDDWKKKLEEVFESTVQNNMNRVRIVGDLFSSGNRPYSDEEAPLTNMILAIRAFSRQIETTPTGKTLGLRHEATPGVGYTYDTTFLLPKSSIAAITHSLEDLRGKYLKYKTSVRSDSSTNMETFFAERGIRLYREADISEGIGVSRALLASMDDDFWETLCKDDGVRTCLDCLQSWVGDSARSLVDPVYHTSLIHTNMLFEQAGLDRVGDIVDGNPKSFLEIGEGQKNDVRRIVILYYLMGCMISWKGHEQPDFSRRLAAILVPICMRGSVWGVAIHATYIENYDTKFADERYWQAYFKTTNDLRHKQSTEFDKCLWDQALHRVERLLETSIAKAGDADVQGDAVVDGIAQANAKMQQETRVSPFAFPYLHIPSQSSAPPNCRVTFSYSGDERFDITWEVLDNRFFLARQPWNLMGTRNFRNSMEVGHRRGFNEMAYRAGMRRKDFGYIEQLLQQLKAVERPN